MRKFIVIIIILCNYFNIFAQDYVEITYSDTFEAAKSKWSNLPMLHKSLRTNTGSPSIIISSDLELDDQTNKVVEYVMSVWEAHIVNGVNLYINIEMSNDIVEDIQTVVRYQENDGIIYPVALRAYLDKQSERDTTYPDGIIRINSKTSWDYALGDNISSNGKNLALGIMRSMARIMGFGSNISINENGEYFFLDKRFHSIFNTLVSNSSGKFLNSIGINKGKPNPQLKSYIDEPNQFFSVSTKNGSYKLASPPYSRNNLPFVYLDLDENNTSLMSSNLSVGNYILQIDKATQDILNQLGWNTQTPSPIIIVGENIPETGLVSAYESHNFTISNKDIPITNPKWVLTIPEANGNVESIILNDNGLRCTTPPITNEKKYKINSDGDIEAHLVFYCKSNGKEIKTPPYNVHFELKPLIEYATITDIHDNAPYASYNASYVVKYRGADKIKVSVEEEYGSKTKSCYIIEPYIATGVADHITSPYYAWIDFVAENKYGKSTYTIELQPYGVTSYPCASNTNKKNHLEKTQYSNNICLNNNDEIIEVYDALGIKIGTYKTMADLNSLPFSGLLIVKRVSNNKVIETFKIIRK